MSVVPVEQQDQKRWDKSDTDKIHCTVVLNNVSAYVTVPKSPPSFYWFLSPVIQTIGNLITCGGWSKKLYRLRDVSGIIKPGEMTMILSPPGHGKSSYLKAVASQLKTQSGEVLYNGRTRNQALRNGNCDVRKIAQYLEQTDNFILPLLNLHESVTFANQMSASKYEPQKVSDIISELGLEEAASTLVSHLSGGQRRRLNIGLTLASDATVLALDEYSNGLDSAVTEKIGAFFKRWASENGYSVVCALQQPTPALFNMFDKVVLLKDAQVVYHGPPKDIVPYFKGMGYECSPDTDVCDFVLNVLTEPRVTLQEIKIIQQKTGIKSTLDKTPIISTSMGDLHRSPVPCFQTEEMLQYYHDSPFYKQMQQDMAPFIENRANVEESFAPIITKETYSKYSDGFRQPIFMMILFVAIREITLMSRSIPPLIFRFCVTFFIGWVHAALYYDIPIDNYTTRVSALTVATTQISFNHMGTLADAAASKPVLIKETMSSMYPAWIYQLSVLITSLPLALTETMTFTLIYYFMQNNYLGWWEWLLYYMTLTSVNIVMGGFFRLCAMLAPDIPAGSGLGASMTIYMIVLSGFFVREDYLISHAPYFLIFYYYWNPLSYAIRTLSQSEFKSPRYDDLIVNAYTQAVARKGDVYLYYVNMREDTMWILWGIIYMFALLVVFVICQSVVTYRPYVDFTRGSQRDSGEEADQEKHQLEDMEVDEDNQQNIQNAINNSILRDQQLAASDYAREHNPHNENVLQHHGDGDDDDDDDDGNNHIHIPQARGSRGVEPSISHSIKSSVRSTQLSQLQSSMGGGRGLQVLTEKVQFSPSYLSFSNIRYTVRVTDLDGVTSDRVLLNDINGYASPGTLTALMGSSGAGKTTLLDVLAGRKTTGVIEGTILYNGVEATPEQQATLTCYVEQFSTLFAFSTVEETLLYAARLRLPGHISDEVKKQVTYEVMDILELSSIRNAMIGNDEIPGLSPSQLKRVSIGVELVANPSILFLDEPTTGLDSTSAQTVMRAIKRVARSGRGCVVTIHQPSSELFFFFDRLCLLGPGGYQLYFGDLGYRSKTFVSYLSSIPGIQAKVVGENPANWMLEEASKNIPADGPADIIQYLSQNVSNWNELRQNQKWFLTLRKYYYDCCPEWKKQRIVLDRIEAVYYTLHPDRKPEGFVMPNEEELRKEKQKAEAIAAADNGSGTLQAMNVESPGAKKSKDRLQVDESLLGNEIIDVKRPTALYQIFWYTIRQSQIYWRNSDVMMIRAVVQTLCSVISGLIYLNIKPSTQSNLISYTAALTLTTAGCFANTMGTISPAFSSGKPCQYRERFSRFYSYPWFYCIATFINELWACFAPAVFTSIPVYFMVGLPSDAGVFWRYFLSTYMVFVIATSVQSFFCTIAPNQGVALLLLGCYASLSTAFNNAAIPYTAMNGWNRFLAMVTPLCTLSWAYLEAALAGNKNDIQLIDGATITTENVTEYAKSYFGYADGYYWKTFGYFCVHIFVWQVFFNVATAFVVYKKR